MTKILLVEDDQFIREIYTETLQSENYSISTARDGEEAYAKIKTENFDLILLDIVLPKLTGLDLVKRLNSEGISRKSSIIFTTNSDSVKDMAAALELGSGYIIKSTVTPSELIEKIKEFLLKKIADEKAIS